MLVVISPEGETLSSQSHGDINQLTGSDDGSSIAIHLAAERRAPVSRGSHAGRVVAISEFSE